MCARDYIKSLGFLFGHIIFNCFAKRKTIKLKGKIINFLWNIKWNLCEFYYGVLSQCVELLNKNTKWNQFIYVIYRLCTIWLVS